jgi:putative membrane protein
MEQTMTHHLFLHWLISGLAVFLTSKFIPGFRVSGFIVACIVALLIGLANAVLWPVLFFLTLPINILTLGLFTFVLNGALLKICAALMPGFEIKSWWSAIFGAIVLSLLSVALHYFII